MNQPRTLFVISLVFGLSLFASGSWAAPAPARATAERPVVKKMVALKTKNAAAVPGETRTVEATLTAGAGDTPVAGKTVSFKFKGDNLVIAVGNAVTDRNGKARVAWVAPEVAQGAYTLTAKFAGDDSTMSATDDANFAMIKGITKVKLGDLIWGALDAHGGPNFGVVMVGLERQADGKALAKPITMTVNGQTWVVNQGSSPTTAVQIALPNNTHNWNVKAQFQGDSANQAAAAQRSYSHN